MSYLTCVEVKHVSTDPQNFPRPSLSLLKLVPELSQSLQFLMFFPLPLDSGTLWVDPHD